MALDAEPAGKEEAPLEAAQGIEHDAPTPAPAKTAGFYERLWRPYGRLDQSKGAVWAACALLALQALLNLTRGASNGADGSALAALLLRLGLALFLYLGHAWARLFLLLLLTLGLVASPALYFFVGDARQAIANAVFSASLILILLGRGPAVVVLPAAAVALLGLLYGALG